MMAMNPPRDSTVGHARDTRRTHRGSHLWSGRRRIIAGDVVHHAMEWEHPEWSPRFDKDPVLSASRTALVERAEAEGLVLLGGHLPPPHAGKIVRVEQRRSTQPLSM